MSGLPQQSPRRHVARSSGSTSQERENADILRRGNEGDSVTATHIVKATTPLRAAREATGREVTCALTSIWVRVTDEKHGHTFGYCFSL